MITVFGDVHGKFDAFRAKLDSRPTDDIILQVGDFGIWPHMEDNLKKGFSRPVYFIDGNHEYFPWLTDINEVTELYPNLFYVPRGTVMELDGRTVLFLGGAESPDKEYRTEGRDWFREESISYEDTDRIPRDVKNVDLMITHTPPYITVHQIFSGDTPPEWNYSSVAVESVWAHFGRPPLVCGHLHFRKTVGDVEILPELGYIRL